MTASSYYASLGSHFDELRILLLRIFLIIGTAFVIFCLFYQPFMHFLTLPLRGLEDPLPSSVKIYTVEKKRLFNLDYHPWKYVLPPEVKVINCGPLVEKVESENYYKIPPESYIDVEEITPEAPLVLLNPLEGFLTMFKISFWSALVATAPLWSYLIFHFAAPGLYPTERVCMAVFLLTSIFFMAFGLYCGFVITLPIANAYFLSFNQELGSNLWTFSSYFDYTLFLLFAHALAFEIGALLLFLVHFRILTPPLMTQYRRHVIILAFILAAILTPPDILSQFLLAIPLLFFYEAAIFYGKWRKKFNNSN